jgi:hypothetical protein
MRLWSVEYWTGLNPVTICQDVAPSVDVNSWGMLYAVTPMLGFRVGKP